MNNTVDLKNVTDGGRLIREHKINHRLIRVFSGEERGKKQEKNEIGKLVSYFGDSLYAEIIYALTHKTVKDVAKAKRLYRDITGHRRLLRRRLKREVGIEVAALDYMKNIKSALKQPKIIEEAGLAELTKRAMTDRATGAYDRAILKNNLGREVVRAKRYKTPLSLLFCDMDDFKKVNDFNGHHIGDIALKKVYETMRLALRETDTVYRYGGDEFVCILPETDHEAAAIAARRLCGAVSQIRILAEEGRERIRLTMSVGVAQFYDGAAADAKAFITAADKMMYEAKRHGKNCVYTPGEVKEEKSRNRIMIVEDDKAFLDELTEGLSMSGYEVLPVIDSAEAIDIARSRRPRAVVLDMKMEKVNGFQIADRLRQFPETAHIPVIAMTGYFVKEEDENLMRMFGLGVYLKKPFDIKNMIEKIKEALK